MRGSRVVAAVAVVLFVFIVIRAGISSESPRQPVGATNPQTATAERAVQAPSALLLAPGARVPAPDFTVRTTSGTAFGLSARRGRIVVLSFLSPGCESCAEEVEALRVVDDRLGASGVEVLLLDLGMLPDEEILEYYQGYLAGGDHLYAEDVDFVVAQRYEVISLGTTVLVDRQGRVAFRDEGLTPASDLLAVVEEALREA